MRDLMRALCLVSCLTLASAPIFAVERLFVFHSGTTVHIYDATTFEPVHSLVERLGAVEKVPVHVCGTHASWRDNVPEDFPDYVDVAESAPAKIADYAALGFVVIPL